MNRGTPQNNLMGKLEGAFVSEGISLFDLDLHINTHSNQCVRSTDWTYSVQDQYYAALLQNKTFMK